MVQIVRGELTDFRLGRVFPVFVNEGDTTLSKGNFVLCNSYLSAGKVKTLLSWGISTPPHYRRGGNVRRMFDYVHDYASSEGVAVSLMHPFSFSYYEKLGYEKMADHRIVRCPTRLIDFVPRACNFVPYDDSRFDDLCKIYDGFARGRTGLLEKLELRTYRENQQTYILYLNGEPSAYIVFSSEKTLFVNNYRDTRLVVHELAYVSPEALSEIFSFIRMFEGELDEVHFENLAPAYEAELMLRHYTHTDYKLLPDLAARIINTELALSASLYPSVEGSFTLRVVDSLSTVDGSFLVEFGGGDSRVRRIESATPDITLTAGALARLVYGYDGVCADSLRYMKGVEVGANADVVALAFPRRSVGVFEHF